MLLEFKRTGCLVFHWHDTVWTFKTSFKVQFKYSKVQHQFKQNIFQHKTWNALRWRDPVTIITEVGAIKERKYSINKTKGFLLCCIVYCVGQYHTYKKYSLELSQHFHIHISPKIAGSQTGIVFITCWKWLSVWKLRAHSSKISN